MNQRLGLLGFLLFVSCGPSTTAPTDGSNNVGVAAQGLIQVPANGGVTTMAGTGAPGATDSPIAANGTLNDPAGVAVANDGTVYVADWGNNSIRRIKPDGSLDTYVKGRPNLISNARAEAPRTSTSGPIPQWQPNRTWIAALPSDCPSCGAPFDGSRVFWANGPGGLNSLLTQNIPATALAPYASNIAAGVQRFHISALAHQALSFTSGSHRSVASIKVDYLSAAGANLGSWQSPTQPAGTWTPLVDERLAPVGTDHIRIALAADDTAPKVIMKATFDQVEVRALPLASETPATDAGIVAPSAVALATNGDLYVGGAGLWIISSGGTVTKVGPTGTYTPPRRVSSITTLPDGSAYIVDPTDTRVHVRGPTGNWYYADVQALPDGEALSIAASIQGTRHRLWGVFRGSFKVNVDDCDVLSTIGTTVTCQPASPVSQLGNTQGFVDDVDGTAGGERFGYMNTIAMGRFGDFIVGDEGNNAVRRVFPPFTLTSAGAGTAGFADGASAQAQFFSPSGVAAAPDGSIVVADRMNNRIRKIACAGTNVCAASGNACAVTPIDDGNSCTADSCQVLAIRHDVAADGASCTDSNACTGPTDTCSAGACVSGPLLPTDDGSLCTTDACNPASGISHTPNYSDNNLTDCLVPSCAPDTGNVTYVPAAEAAPCGGANSNRFCNEAAVCETAAPTVPVAPPLDTSTGTSFDSLAAPIWNNGANSLQTGVAANKMEPGHGGWLVGKVRTASGNPLPNVVVTVAGDSSYGSTKTRADGRFDLIVNGGKSHILHFEKPGHLSAERQVYVGWEETSPVPDVVMLTPNPHPTLLGFGASGGGTTAFQVATGSLSTDADGPRTGVLMVPKGIKAVVGGVAQSSLNLHITEYTVGEDGPARMPAPLPPTSAYTYAVEVSADGASSVNFTDSANGAAAVYYYVENFIQAAPGAPIPSGYYDRTLHVWVASENGLVIKVLHGKSLPAGSPAQISVNADDGQDAVLTDPAFASLHFTNEELLALATKYADGTTLWRMPIVHLSDWDFNLGFSDTCGSTCKNPYLTLTRAQHMNCERKVDGSIIGCETQSLGESVPLAGSSLSLNYNSTRMPLYSKWRTLTLGVPPIDVPDLESPSWQIEVWIAGKQVYLKSQSGRPPSSVDVKWDGLDAFGRPVIGGATATVTGSFKAKQNYLESVPYFGAGSGLPQHKLIRNQRPFVYRGQNTFYLETTPPVLARGAWSLGGWTLSAHHFYDTKGHILYLGSGETRVVDPGLYTVTRIAGSGGGMTFAPDDTSAVADQTGINPDNSVTIGVAVASNGDVYYTDNQRFVVRRINALGQVKTIAGIVGTSHNCTGNRGDRGNALLAPFRSPKDLAFGRNGELYVSDEGDATIRVLRPTGTADSWTIDTVAGKPCVNGPATSDVPATQATFDRTLGGVAVGPDGYVYVGDRSNKVIRRFLPGGKIYTVAGQQGVGYLGNAAVNGKPATSVGIDGMDAIAVGPNGAIYTESDGGRNLLRITPDGTVDVLSAPYVAGDPVDEGVSSTTEPVDRVRAIASTPDGNLIFNHELSGGSGASYIRSIDPSGLIQSITKSNGTPPVDGAPALQNGPVSAGALAVSPDGATIVFAHNSIYRISTGTQSSALACGDVRAAHLIPDGDQAYCFDSTGRHLSTVNWRTKKPLLTFGYAGTAITSITDANNQVTGIAADANPPTKYTIVAANKQATTISVNGQGNASAISDALGLTILNPQPNGYLDSLTDRNGNLFSFQFDDDGLLSSDKSPLSSVAQLLGRSNIAGGYRVAHTTPLLRVTTYDVTTDAVGNRSTLITAPNQTTQQTTIRKDGRTVVTAPDGTVVTTTVGPDPVMGIRAAFPTKTVVTLPTSQATLTTTNAICPPSVNDAIATQYFASARNATVSCNSQALADPLSDKPAQTPPFTNPTHATLKRESSSTGEMLTGTSAAGRTSVETRDAQGRRLSTQIGSLTPTVFNYTTPGHPEQLTSITRGGRTTTFQYRGVYESDPVNKAIPDADAGYMKAVTASVSAPPTAFKRDIFGRVLTETGAQGVAGQEGATGFAWDPNGNLKLLKPPGRPDHSLFADAINTLQTYTPPAVAGLATVKTDYTTTADRTPDGETRPDGVTIRRFYATAATAPLNSGLLTSIAFSGGTSPAGTLSFDYYLATEHATGQAPGRLKTIKGPYSASNVLTFNYDGARATSMSWAGEVTGSVSWGYDSTFLLSSETVSPGASTVYFTRDQDDLVTCVSQTAGSTCAAPLAPTDLSITRSPEHGQAIAIVTGDVTELLDYSDTAADKPNQAFGELRHHLVKHGSTVLMDITYDAAGQRRDDLGRIHFKTETFRGLSPTTPVTQSWEYEYDERNRLETVRCDSTSPSTYCNSGNPMETFGYDTNGNRTSYIGPSATVPSTVYDNQDRLTTYGSTTFTYGANGEIRTKTVGGQVTTYTYDALGNLVTVQRPGSAPLITYLLDGLGRRVGKKVGATIVKRWLYHDGLSPIAELDGTSPGALVSRFVYGSRPNVPDLVIRGGQTYRLIVDQLGSPREAVNVRQDTLEIPYRVDYTAFGEALPAGGFTSTVLDWIPFGFAGGVYDPDTGLVRFGARDYDPTVGRWVSKDPILFGGRQTNLYVYAGNDPINRQDPSGLQIHIPQDPFWDWMQSQSDAWFEIAGTNYMNGDVVASIGPAAFGAIVDFFPWALQIIVEVAPVCGTVGMNPRAGAGRINTDLPGGRAAAKSLFRNISEGPIDQAPLGNGGIRRWDANGNQIRMNPDGSTRIDLPTNPRETIHYDK